MQLTGAASRRVEASVLGIDGSARPTRADTANEAGASECTESHDRREYPNEGGDYRWCEDPAPDPDHVKGMAPVQRGQSLRFFPCLGDATTMPSEPSIDQTRKFGAVSDCARRSGAARGGAVLIRAGRRHIHLNRPERSGGHYA